MGANYQEMKRSFIRKNIIAASNLTKLGCAPFLRMLQSIRQEVRAVSSLTIRHPDKEQPRHGSKKSIPFGDDSESRASF